MEGLLLASFFFGLGCNGGDKVPDSVTDSVTDSGTTVVGTCSTEELDETYSQYVEPFVSGSVPSSCSQCHMTGIDLSLYAQDTPCETMACMVDLGVVDLSDPASSGLLAQILMGDSNSSVFNVQEEHDALLAWIEWGAECHSEICGEVESACSSGTGTESTGVNPIGDCSEQDLLATFWDALIIDRQRCATCHTESATTAGTFGPCTSLADCDPHTNQQCLDGYCRLPGAYLAPNFFEGLAAPLVWSNPDDQQLGLNTLYNVVALGLVDVDTPLSSSLLTKPLLENFQPTAIYGPGVEISSVTTGEGVGVYHGGTSKYNFGCHAEPCPTEGVVDCRIEQSCSDGGQSCPNGLACSDGYCRLEDSVCDMTYVRSVAFVDYFSTCK